MESKLVKLAKELNKRNVTWALGGSYMLYSHGIINTVNDIDILLDENDVEKVDAAILNIAEKKEAISREPFSTKYFMVYNLDGTSIDAMGGFQISHSNGTYNLRFDNESIPNYMHIRDIKVPLSSLEDWYILYSLIPGKQYKADLIEAYWKNNGIENLNLLCRAMDRSLPYHVYSRLNHLLMLNQKE